MSLFAKHKILIIPSGGLSGLDTPSFKKKLSDYTEQGGTIICFSQQYGEEFEILPGKPSGYGWRQDQSCWTNAVYIENPHPIFSGQTNVNLTSNCDGYFTSWPEDSTILLMRRKNLQPAMLSYQYGSGTVIVSTLYSDYGYRRNHTSRQERRLIRDIIAWAKSNREIVEIEPGERVNYELRMLNVELAEKVRMKVYGPEKELVTAYTLPLTATITFTYQTSATSTLGIYKEYTESLMSF